MNSARQMDKLVALRFKTKMDGRNLSREEIVGISSNEIPCMRAAMPTGETYNKYGDTAREVEIDAVGNHGFF